MKKLIFFVLTFFFFLLYADETPVWTSQPDWVTGPETEQEFYGNQMTYLLPFGIKVVTGNCWKPYVDDYPVLYETDMGWPVPDETGTNLKYLLFGDTKFFMRNSVGDIVNQVTDENGVLVNFDVSETGHNPAEIVAHELSEFMVPPGLIYPMTFFCEKKCIKENCTENDYTCMYNCQDTCKDDHFANYNDCLSLCESTDYNYSELLEIYTDIANDPDPAITKCKNFCSFAITEAYTCMRYFDYPDFLDESMQACSDVQNPNIFSEDFYNIWNK